MDITFFSAQTASPSLPTGEAPTAPLHPKPSQEGNKKYLNQPVPYTSHEGLGASWDLGVGQQDPKSWGPAGRTAEVVSSQRTIWESTLPW
jgi:hypothetical protein